MKLTIPVSNSRQHIDTWLTLFQAGSGLTPREKSILVEVLVRREELSKSGIKEPFLTKLLFNVDSRKIYAENLEITSFSLANSFASMRDKDILSNEYEIEGSLIPETKLEFEFKYDN